MGDISAMQVLLIMTYWLLLHALPLFYFVFIVLLCFCLTNRYTKTPRKYVLNGSVEFPFRGYLRVQVGVLLHELYPIKESPNTSPSDHLGLTSQDFIHALRKMDLEDNYANDMNNSRELSCRLPSPFGCSTSPLCFGTSGPSTSTVPVKSELALCPSPVDLWLPHPRNSLEAPEPPRFMPHAPTHAVEDSPVIALSDTCGLDEQPSLLKATQSTSTGCVMNRTQNGFGAVQIGQTNAAPSTLSCSASSTSSDNLFPRDLMGPHSINPAATLSYTCPSSLFELDHPSLGTSSSSDSEVDYRTEYIPRSAISVAHRLRARSFFTHCSSSQSLNDIKVDTDLESLASTEARCASSKSKRESGGSGLGRSEHHLRDAEIFEKAHIPFTYEQVVRASNEEFREMRSSPGLTDSQLSVMLDVRRRAVNRMAAERCRRLKVATRDELEERLSSLRFERQVLQRQLAQARQRKQRANDSLLAEQKRVLSLLRGPDGCPLKYTDWRVRLSNDDEVIVVAAGL